MENVLFVISGPSGVGKGTLVRLLLQEDDGLALSVSCTTRKARDDEKNGREYYFISREEFVSRVEEGDFLEYNEHFGNLYGTPKTYVLEQLKEKSVILEIEVMGAFRARAEMQDKVPVVLIMIVPPNRETLEARLAGRQTESAEERALRLKRTDYELSLQNEYDYVIVNDDLEKTKTVLQTIIRDEKARRKGDKI